MSVLNQTGIGYSHLKSHIDCQDFSLSFSNNYKSMIMVSDGHGGKQYIRSDRGSKYACLAAFTLFNRLDKNKISMDMSVEYLNKLKLELLCEWNHLVEQDYGDNPFSEKEVKSLNENQRDRLRDNPSVAYGCTLHAGLIVNNILLSFTIGDGGMFAISDNSMIEISKEDDNVANITNSLCDDKAYNDISVNVTDISKYKGVIAVTDGVVNPYQSYSNFMKSFALPIVNKLCNEGDVYEVKDFIIDLGKKKGIGDDVSLAVYYR